MLNLNWESSFISLHTSSNQKNDMLVIEDKDVFLKKLNLSN